MHSYKGGILWPAQQHQRPQKIMRVDDDTIISVVKKNILPSQDYSQGGKCIIVKEWMEIQRVYNKVVRHRNRGGRLDCAG